MERKYCHFDALIERNVRDKRLLYSAGVG